MILVLFTDSLCLYYETLLCVRPSQNVGVTSQNKADKTPVFGQIDSKQTASFQTMVKA